MISFNSFVAMEYRAHKTGDERYRLDDPDETYDTSSWGRTFDGTMSPCRESTFAFIAQVVSEMKMMYRQAGLWDDENPPLFHIGGDETPPTSWKHSPLCDALVESGEISSLDELFHYFIKKTVHLVDFYGFRVAAWEEAFIVGKSVLIFYTNNIF